MSLTISCLNYSGRMIYDPASLQLIISVSLSGRIIATEPQRATNLTKANKKNLDLCTSPKP